MIGEIVDGAAHVARGALGREGVHQFARFVHLIVRGQFPMIEIRCERHEPGGSKPIGHFLDSGIEAPPFLDDQDSRAVANRGLDEIP